MEINREGSNTKVKHSCQVCVASFTKDGFLRNHIRRCHTVQPDKFYEEQDELLGRGKRRKISTGIATRGVASASKTLLDPTKYKINEKNNSEIQKSLQSSCKRFVGRTKKSRVQNLDAEKMQSVESCESGAQNDNINISTNFGENVRNDYSIVDVKGSNDVSDNCVKTTLNDPGIADNAIDNINEASKHSVVENVLNSCNRNITTASVKPLVKRKRGRPSKQQVSSIENANKSKESETGNTIIRPHTEILTRRKESLTAMEIADQTRSEDEEVEKISSKERRYENGSKNKKLETTVADLSTNQISDSSEEDEDAINSILNDKETGSDKIKIGGKMLRSRLSRSSQVLKNLVGLRDDDGCEIIEGDVEVKPRKRGRPKKPIIKEKIGDNVELKQGSDSGEEECSDSQLRKKGRPKKGVEKGPRDLTENDSDVEEEEDTNNCKPRKARGRKKRVIFEYSEFADEILSRKRGRPKNTFYQRIMKNHNSLEPNKIEKITCACLREFPSLKEFRVHNLRAHYGLFRKLGDGKPFTDYEKKVVLGEAIKLLKKLRCLNQLCGGKAFTTVPGYLYHINVCGVDKEQRMVTCDICGKTLLEASLYAHKKGQHDTTKVIPKLEEIDPSKQRLSAKKAVEKMALIPNDAKFDKQDASDADFESDAVWSDDENADDLELPEDKTGKVSRKTTGSIPHDEKVLKEIWRKDLNLKGSAYCRNEGCIHKENELEKILDHFFRCSFRQYDIYECKICEIRKERKELLSDHIMHEHSELIRNDKSTDFSVFVRKFCCQAKPPTCKVDKRNRKARQHLNTFLRNTFTQYITQTKEFNGIEFPDWLPFISYWVQVPRREIKLFLPKIKCSSGFKCQKSCNVTKDCDWKKLKLFESIGSSDEQKFKMCFVGGPVKACAWCPTSLQTSSNQYLALYCHNDPDVLITNKEICNNSCLIQIWNVGELEQRDNSPGKLVLAIADKFGAVWDLSWCPSGCWNVGENIDSKFMPRIGLLSAACADGFVKIYSIPCPSSLKFDGEIPMYKVKPTAVLILNPNINSYSRVQCTTLSWFQGKGHEFIAGGYANGIIAVWHLKSKSSLTMIEKENGDRLIVSHLCFRGHGNIVTGLDFSPLYLGKYLVSCSRDRSVKFWNLENVSLPINMIKNRAVNKVKWHPFWCGVFLASDNCYSLKYNGVVYVGVDFLGELGGSPSHHDGSINDLSISLWMKCIASCDEAGEVMLSVFSDVKCINLTSNYKQQLLFSVSLTEGKNSECEAKHEENSMSLESFTAQFRYKDAARKFKTIYTDHSINQKIETSEALMNCYPLNSVNKVVWNPNLGSHCWLASGDQFGMLRLYNASSVDLVSSVISVDKIRQDLKT